MSAAAPQGGGSRIAALRREFDERFAAPRALQASEVENLLVIGVGDERFAMRLLALAGFEPLRRLVPLAGARRGVRGIAGVRGRLVPVLDLAHVLGVAEAHDPAWLALCGRGDTVLGLACAAFHGQRQVPVAAVRPAGADLSRAHAPDVALLDGRPVPVLDLDSIARHAAAAAVPAPNLD